MYMEKAEDNERDKKCELLNIINIAVLLCY